MKNTTKSFCLWVLISIFAGTTSQAGHISLGLGAADISRGGDDLSFGVGTEIALSLSSELTLGLASLTYARERDDVTYSVSSSLLKLNYHLEGSQISGLKIGLGIGAAQESNARESGDGTLTYSESEFTVGGDVAYNFALSDSWGLAPKFHFNRVFNHNGAKYNVWAILASITWSWGD